MEARYFCRSSCNQGGYILGDGYEMLWSFTRLCEVAGLEGWVKSQRGIAPFLRRLIGGLQSVFPHADCLCSCQKPHHVPTEATKCSLPIIPFFLQDASHLCELLTPESDDIKTGRGPRVEARGNRATVFLPKRHWLVHCLDRFLCSHWQDQPLSLQLNPPRPS